MWTLAVHNSDELSAMLLLLVFHLNHWINASLSRIFFQDFPGPRIFKKKKFTTFQEAWEPWGTCPSVRTLDIYYSQQKYPSLS